MTNKSLLIELRTEELPPKALRNLSEHFAKEIVDSLEKALLIEKGTEWEIYATPRRLGLLVKNVLPKQNKIKVVKKGPSVKVGLDENGKPTKALEGFLRSNGIEFKDLGRMDDGKQEVFVREYEEEGRGLSDLLGDFVAESIKKLPIPKMMRWGASPYTFVRPAHSLVALHGDEVVDMEVLGLKSGRTTMGHRILAKDEIEIADADSYKSVMRDKGFVVVDFDARKKAIHDDVTKLADARKASVVADDALFEEVTGLVEWPVVLEGSFEERFLGVPQECLILTMQQNQKYFPLVDKENKLINHFLLVSNLQTPDGKYDTIVKGNERVLRARLSDAEFFYKQDLKNSLESRLEALNNVVYHNKIGSQRERVDRLVKLSIIIAGLLKCDVAQSERATLLSKCDLVTEMVGEFPELQGTMGYYYALHDKESKVVATAIKEHYKPRFSHDDLPEGMVSTVVALSDKIETLVGIFGIGLIPTGDKDPFALRRQALGVIRMMMNLDLDVCKLIKTVHELFPKGILSQESPCQVYEFILARLDVLLQQNYPVDIVRAVLNKKPTVFNDLEKKLEALKVFTTLPEAQALASANKRVKNLVKKADQPLGDVNEELLSQDEEKALLKSVRELTRDLRMLLSNDDFEGSLRRLAKIEPEVDKFFEKVMVMDPDPKVKQNRLNLLNLLSDELNRIADIGELSSQGEG